VDTSQSTAQSTIALNFWLIARMPTPALPIIIGKPFFEINKPVMGPKSRRGHSRGFKGIPRHSHNSITLKTLGIQL